MSNFFRTVLQKLFPASDWAKKKHLFIEENQKTIRNLILLVGVFLVLVIPFFDPVKLAYFAATLLILFLTVVRSVVWARVFLAERLGEALDRFVGEDIVCEILASVERQETSVKPLGLAFVCSVFQKRTTKKIKFITHLGAALRSLTFAPSFPRFVLISA